MHARFTSSLSLDSDTELELLGNPSNELREPIEHVVIIGDDPTDAGMENCDEVALPLLLLARPSSSKAASLHLEDASSCAPGMVMLIGGSIAISEYVSDATSSASSCITSELELSSSILQPSFQLEERPAGSLAPKQNQKGSDHGRQIKRLCCRINKQLTSCVFRCFG
jgi:hypothetical protein